MLGIPPKQLPTIPQDTRGLPAVQTESYLTASVLVRLGREYRNSPSQGSDQRGVIRQEQTERLWNDVGQAHKCAIFFGGDAAPLQIIAA